MTPASRGDGHQESYDANVSHFVLHTSSLISLLSCSVQAGSAQHRFRERWHSLQIICTNIVCLHHPPSFFFFLSVSLLAPLVWLFLFLLSLSVLLHLCFSHWALSLSLSLSVARGSWLPCWCRYLKLWVPRGHQSWKNPFPPTVQPVGQKKINKKCRDTSAKIAAVSKSSPGNIS